MTKAEKLAILNAELTEIKTAISVILGGGQSYTITSLGSGTTRTVTNANYKDLLAEKKSLESQIANIEGRRAMRIRAGW